MGEDERRFVQGLEVEVEAELDLVWSSESGQTIPPPSEWLIDPTDIEREEVGLSNLYGAVEAARNAVDAGEPQPDPSSADPQPPL